MDNVCGICKKPFDDYLRVDCGGDCRVCLAASGDPDCINGLVSEIERLRESLMRIENLDYCTIDCSISNQATDIARAALKGDE
jgi:hypothetical protein